MEAPSLRVRLQLYGGRHGCRRTALAPSSHIHVYGASCAQTYSRRDGIVVTKNGCLETATISSNVIGQKEDVLNMSEAMEFPALDSAAIVPKKVLLKPIKAVCFV